LEAELKINGRSRISDFFGHHFMTLIDNLLRDLTDAQKSIIDKIWAHYVETGSPYLMRSLQHAIGKTSLAEVLNGMNGSIIYETTEQNDTYYNLTLIGCLITADGRSLYTLLIRFLDYLKDAFEKDQLLTAINSATLMNHLELSEQEVVHLFCVLRLCTNLRDRPFWLTSHAPDSNGLWSIKVDDNITKLYVSPNSQQFIEPLIAATYDSKTPISYADRIRHISSNNQPFSSTFPSVFKNESTYSPFSPFISLDRISSLQEYRGNSFDLSKLVRLCEEINTCAADGSAYAVIMLTRAILDHIPPIFGHKTFAEVTNNYEGDKSFKDAMKNLQNGARNIADLHMHTRIRKFEAPPNMTQVNFSRELDLLLAESLRKLLHDN
jgi:hypothetical protein